MRFSTTVVPFLASVALSLFVVSSASCQSPDRDLAIKPIVDVWAKREAATKNARFVWRQENTSVGILKLIAADAARRGIVKPSAASAPAVAISQVSSLCLDGDRFSYTVDTEGAKEFQMPPHYRSTFDGTTSQSYAAIETENRRAGTGTATIRLDSSNLDMTRPSVRPLLLAFRPLNQRFGRINMLDYRVSPARGRIGEVSCLILEHAGEQQPHKSYWLDPDRDYIVLRELQTFKGQEQVRTDIFYERDESFGWIPRSWKVVTLDRKGSFDGSFIATVSEYKINLGIRSSEFQLELPDGTQVHDQSKGVRELKWIGGHPSGFHFGSRTRLVLLVVNLLAVVLIIGIIIIRRYIRRP
jgi:hypothetical protein